jgi:predicted DNA-binding transcriptional regulator AlpA
MAGPDGTNEQENRFPFLLERCEFIDSPELAARLGVPVSWVRDQVRSRVTDPLPHVHLGKYVRFLWGSLDLEEWLTRRIVKGNNRRVERVR